MTNQEFEKKMLPYVRKATGKRFKIADALNAEAARMSHGNHQIMTEKGVVGERVSIPGYEDSPELDVILYKPQVHEGKVPGVIYLHGSGYMSGNPEDYALFPNAFVTGAECVVAAPNYRKSHTAPYPAALHDCYATLLWMVDNANELGIDPDRICVTGVSAGAGLTIALCLFARDMNGPKIKFQMPIYPTMDDRLETRSSTEYTYPYVLDRQSCENIWNLYLGEGHKERDIPIYASPARATVEQLKGLPPCFSYVGELDPHRDETVAYCEKLYEAGVWVGYHVYAGCHHGFDMLSTAFPMARLAIEEQITMLKYWVNLEE